MDGGEASAAGGSPVSDLARVDELLERCWRELDNSDLNIKLTDIVRLLEFKARLRPAADAETVFWSLINQLRQEELTESQ